MEPPAELKIQKEPGVGRLRRAGAYWQKLGPGLTTGAADDDPSGIATYSQTGAQTGFRLAWLAAFTFPLMAVVQEMCARIGMVTGRGLAANIRLHYPRRVLYACTLLLFAANTFNIGVDLGAMAEATQLLVPNVNFFLLIIVFTLGSLALQIFTSYKAYARYLKYLALVLFSYVVAAFFVDLDWGSLARHTLVPSFSFSRDEIFLITAILGTTISPYLFFWQTSQEVEEEILQGKRTIKERQGVSPEEIRDMRIDVWSGMLISNVVMFFIIALSAATLWNHGITTIGSAAQAAEALRPLVGTGAYLLFSLGIIGTGLLTIPILAGAASYAITESFRWHEGLYRKFKEAHAFYGVIIVSMAAGMAMNFLGLDPIRALIYAAIANGLVAPLVLFLIVRVSSNRKIMGEYANSPLVAAIGWIITAAMTAAAIATIYFLL